MIQSMSRGKGRNRGIDRGRGKGKERVSADTYINDNGIEVVFL